MPVARNPKVTFRPQIDDRYPMRPALNHRTSIDRHASRSVEWDWEGGREDPAFGGIVMAGVRLSPGWFRGSVLLLLAAFGFGAVRAETPVASAPAVVRAEMTPTDVETFLDGLVPLQIESNDIAGATIAIVKDGKLLFAKGYGFADMKTRAPVTPETMFRVGSITKVFTWTAVMQLVEQGKLDLDADINLYLDFKIPQKFGKPVTMRHLMTHRGGFQEAIKGLGAQNTGKVDLQAYVRDRRPDQIFEPGSTPSYSNYGTALAGYIVQRISGMPFDTYLEERIYAPLGMMRTAIRQPLPKDLEPFMSQGYQLASGEPIPYEIVNGYPAGSQASSALDMTKFMLVHLGGGTLGDAQILKPETVALMHNTVTAVDPRQNGIALGFYETSRNGMRIISHGGDTVPFHSDMHLIPSENLGFFVSYNSSGRGDTPPRGSVWRKFLDRYYPYAPPAAEPAKPGLTAKDVEGSYQTSRRADTSLLKFFSELSQPTVTAHEDGSLEVSALIGVNGQPRRWTPLGDGVFRDTNGQDRLIFAKGQDGRIQLLSWASGVMVFQRVDFFQSSLFYVTVFLASALVLLLNLLLWPVAAIVRRRYYAALEWRMKDHLLRLGTMLAAAALLTMIVGIASVFIPRLDDPWTLDGTLDPTMRLFQYIGIGGAVFTLVALWNAAQSWTNPVRGILGRLKETAVALSCVGLLWFAWTMNLFDLSLRY